MSEEFVISPDGAAIAYEKQGKGDLALVFVHGMACNRTHWERQMEAFADRHVCVAVDLCGHGQSRGGREALTGEAFADDVIAVIDHLALDRIVLLGHSMGGYVIPLVARRLAQRVIGLIGVDTWSALDSEYRAPDLGRFEADFDTVITGFVKSMFPPDADPRIVERVTQDNRRAGPDVVLNVLRNVGGGDSVGEILRALAIAKHAIGSDTFSHKDAGVAADYGITLHKMNNVGHFMMLEQPERFNALLADIVASIDYA